MKQTAARFTTDLEFDLPTLSRQKSYYGKATVKEVTDDSGRITAKLYSYNTLIAIITIDNDTVSFSRVWPDWSATTGKHVNSFRKLYKLLPISKHNWDN